MIVEIEPYSLLIQVNDLHDENESMAIDLLLEVFNSSSFNYINELCLTATQYVMNINMNLLVALLTFTVDYKNQIISRDWLFAAVMARAVEEKHKNVYKLLYGLEGSNITPW